MENKRGDLETLMRMALSGVAGAADETAFGLLEKNSDFVKNLRKENPDSFTGGQVGSYFIPGTGILGGAKLLGKGLGLTGKAAKLAASPAGASMLKQVLKAAGKGALEGAVESGGQTAIRKALGTSQDNIGESAKSGGTLGAILGSLSPVAGKAARNIYSHPAIFNQKSPKSPDLMEKLMNEGVWGGEGTFRKYSKKAKDKYTQIMDPMREQIAKKKVSFNNVVGEGLPEGFAEREWNKKTTGSNAVGQFTKTREGARARLGDTPSMKRVQDYQKVLNEELATLQPQKRAEAISGVGGNASNEDQAMGAMKSSIENLEKRLIGKKFGQNGLDKVKVAKESYGTGRELERALNRPESLTQAIKNATPVPAAAGGLSGLASVIAGASNPASIAAAGIGTAAAAAGRSLPGRTGLGVLANKFGQNPSGAINKAVRATEMMGRDEGDKTLPPGEPEEDSNPFQQYVPKKKPVEEVVPPFRKLEDPKDGNPRTKSRGSLGISKKELETIRKLPAHPPGAKNTEEGVENPFLQYVPSR